MLLIIISLTKKLLLAGDIGAGEASNSHVLLHM